MTWCEPVSVAVADLRLLSASVANNAALRQANKSTIGDAVQLVLRDGAVSARGPSVNKATVAGTFQKKKKKKMIHSGCK